MPKLYNALVIVARDSARSTECTGEDPVRNQPAGPQARLHQRRPPRDRNLRAPRPIPEHEAATKIVSSFSLRYEDCMCGCTLHCPERIVAHPEVVHFVLRPASWQARVAAEHLSDVNRYVGSVLLNGKPLRRGFVRHEEILAGGELRFVMSARPDKSWGTLPNARSFSMTPYR